MDDLFLPGWQVPPGTWPYSIQDLLQAVFPPAAAPSDAGARSSSSSAGPPSGGLLGVLAKPNIDWNRGFAASDSPAGGGLFSSLDRSDIGRSPNSLDWLQTAMLSSFGEGQPLPWSDPRPEAMSSPSSPPPRTPDPSAPYWLQTIPPFQANGSGLPLSIPLDNEPTDVQPQQWLTTKQESSALPLPPTLAPTFPSFPPNLSWNDGTRQLPQIPVRPAAQRGGADGPTQLNSDRGRNIPGLWPNFPAPGYANRAPDETPTTLPPPYNAVAASPTEQARSSQPWPISSLDNLGIGGRPIESRGATRNPQIMSDVLPDNTWIPGARYAAEERNSGGVPARIEGREFEIEGGLAGRLVEAQTRAEHALAQVRKLDPNWRPRPSFFEGVQGAIRAYESEAEQAQARLRELAVRDLWERIPKERPPAARDRNDIARDTARWFAKHHRHVIEGVAWLSELEPSIEAYLDPPKSLEDLQRAVSYARAGSDIHHIVEKTSAEEDGFPKSMIHGRENLVRIPRFKHWEITSWYMTKNENYDGLSPRDYLRGRDWDERRRVGLDALVRHGVLK